ncbi:MAG: DUF1592 domain-containing protein [Pseudomonadota bacterium]
MHNVLASNNTLKAGKQPAKKPLALALMAIAVIACNPAANAQSAAPQHDFAALKQADQFWPYFEDYCTECHNFDDFFGGVDFTGVSPTDVPTNPELFEKVLKKLRGRMMPPPNKIRPDEQRTDAFIAWMESYLDEAGLEEAYPEHVVIHRLNRKEYANAIRDLFALDVKPAEILPADPTADGFDNIAEALQVSPAFINQYVSAARSIAEQVVGDPAPALGSVAYKAPEILAARATGGGSQQFHIDGLPLGTRGGMLVEHWFPADGEYSVNVGDFDLSAWMYNIEFENKMIVTIDGEKVYETILGGDADRIALDKDQGEPLAIMNGRTKDIRFTTSAGPHKVGVTFVRHTFAESDDTLQHFIPGAVQDRILNIPSVEVRGPFVAAGISNTPTREKIFSCYPEDSSQENLCAEEIITNIATRAYRRPLTDEDKAPLLAFYNKGKEAGGFEEGIRQALTRTLASPSFLYRAEVAPDNLDPGAVYQLGSLDLASRLSFFLWSSIPDDELLELAIANKLEDPGVLEGQVKRMLADPRSSALAENFAAQWLKLGKLDELNPDDKIFPYASGPGDLRPDFRKEIALFIDSVFREDQSIMRLMDADYTYLNERLALHYGINDVKGDRFRRVDLKDSNRWGLLGKGGVLMATAYPNRTSPVLRGAWILETIMGTPPPVPPPNVEALPENAAGTVATTVRARLEQHRANPQCNACHSVMDPLGFALDNFDAVGKWRDRDRYTGEPVDASGIMPNGSVVNGPQDLRAALLARPSLFAQSLTEKLMTYALGRPMEARDMPVVRSVVRAAAEDDYRFSTLITSIIETKLFQMKKVPEVTSIENAGDVALNGSSTPTN